MTYFLHYYTCLVILIYVHWSIAGGDDEEKCSEPKKVVAYQWNVTDANVPLFLPIGQRNDTDRLKELLYRSSLNPDQDLTKLCHKMTIEPMSMMSPNNKIIYSGTNGTQEAFSCKVASSDPKKWAWDCQHDGGRNEFNHKLFVTLTDGKSYALAVRCWGSSGGGLLRGWTVFSTKKFLHEDVQFQILEHIKSLDFDTVHSLPLRYKDCK